MNKMRCAARALAAAGVMVVCQVALASSSDEALLARIAELERQLQALKEEVASRARPGPVETEVVSPQSSPSLADSSADDERAASVAMNRVEEPRFAYGGFVQMDALHSDYSDGRPPSLMDDIFVPSLIPVATGSSSDRHRNSNVHAKTSRFHFGTATDTAAGVLRSHVELDFVLSGQGDERVSNSFSSRIRHAFVEWEYAPGRSLMAGQNWSTFMNTAAVPDLLDLVGPVGVAFERQPQLRWTRGALQLALENPVTRVDAAAGGARVDDSETLPDVVARYNGRTGGLDWSVAGLLRELNAEARPDPSIEVGSDSALGAAVSIAGRWELGADDLRFMLNYGDGLGRYMGLNAFSDAWVASDYQVRGLEQWGVLLAYRRHWSPDWYSNLSLSLAGADNPDAQRLAGAGLLSRRYRSLHANLNYQPAPGLRLGTEVLFARRELENGLAGDLARLQFALRYSF
ncbi:MAG: DcaP family trimeric outer membrane transporter [Chromatocurvus sp.]